MAKRTKVTTARPAADKVDSITETICTAVVIARKLVEAALGWHKSAGILGEGGLYAIYGDDAKKAFLADFRALELRLVKISEHGIGPQEANRWRGLPGVPVPLDAASWHEAGWNLASQVHSDISLLADPRATTNDQMWDLVLSDVQEHLPRFNAGQLVSQIRIENAIAERREAEGRADVITPVPVALTVSAKLSPSDLAGKHRVSLVALRKRLDRWRYEHDAGYSEVANAKRNEPKYLYDESAVMPVIEAIKAKSVGQERATDGQQKKI